MKTFALCLLCLLVGFNAGWNISRTERQWYALARAWHDLQERPAAPKGATPGNKQKPVSEPQEAIAGVMVDIQDWVTEGRRGAERRSPRE